jgi:CheY-like chemotaxis protein
LLNEPLSEFQKKQIDILKFSADNLLNIINDILDYSKLEAEKIELENQHISIAELACKIKESHWPIAKNKNIGFDLSIDSQIPKYVIGDSKYLIQVLNNLVSNAIKFTEKGSVTLNFECVGKTESEVSIKISVTDTGIGIEESKLPLIFERFTQENSDTKRKYGGTGLGLAISQRLIQFMGSKIKVYSKKGVGSVFWFELTLAISPKDYALFTDRPHDINQILEKTVSVLLVEDNEINQLVAGNFLNKWNIAYDVAENGKIAVEMVKTKKYDLILMDIQMPEMNGYEATRIIRLMDSEHYKKVPIIALTASAMMEIRDKIEENGINDCITKPFKPEELKETIARYVAAV